MLLCHLDAAVAEQHRYLINWNSGQQQFYRKGVAEHVGVATFACAVRISDIGDSKQLAKATLVILHGTAQVAMAAPEKMIGAHAWQSPQ